MKKIFVTIFVVCAMSATAGNRLLGGDISLVPAYEEAGDIWLDQDGNPINTYYEDGMVTFLHDNAQWNAIRVRVMADPSLDDDVSTCQDLDYVKKLGKRIKDAGLMFLLDIFYSDTWADPTKQWIPTAWGMDRNTDTATLAAQVGNYTKEVLEELIAYGATPDYVQVGNEVSYGMLWDTMTGKSTNNKFSPGGSYSSQQTKIERFATLLNAGAEQVRALLPNAKIILHSERAGNTTQTINYYTWVEQAGFTDYDIIGLSYYPMWQGTLSTLSSTISSIITNFPSKEIQVVETAYWCDEWASETTNCTWPLSYAGQAQFMADLIATLNQYEQVTGLYYWCPEECGNGADVNGNNRVMPDWLNRGLWELTWQSSTHTLDGAATLEAMKAFNPSLDGIRAVRNDVETAEGTVYTISGMRVSDMSQKGVYVVDGKKVIKR